MLDTHPLSLTDEAIYGPKALKFAEHMHGKDYSRFPPGEREADRAVFDKLVDEWRRGHSSYTTVP